MSLYFRRSPGGVAYASMNEAEREYHKACWRYKSYQFALLDKSITSKEVREFENMISGGSDGYAPHASNYFRQQILRLRER